MTDHGKTDWQLIRQMMESAIDFCENLEAAGYSENDRGKMIQVGGQEVSLHDIVTSAWTIPENLGHDIIRERHSKGDDLAYVMETSRILVAMAQAAAELANAEQFKPAQEKILRAIEWYKINASHFTEQPDVKPV